MNVKDVYMGKLVTPWMASKNIKYITFSVTDDCNLMCKYCYFTHKTNKNRMTFEVAKKAIDYILEEEKFLIHDGVVWEFIGGEPTLEMDLIDQICDYILYKMYTMKHKWLYCYRFMIGTNGLLYSSSKVQELIKKHGHNLHINITVDGSKAKHDLSRIKKDGSGSYDDIVKILPMWFKQTGNYTTKATFAHDDLPYLKESIINLWNIGFKNVMANVVFENVWVDGDDKIYEEQLCQLADYIIKNNLWNKVSVRFFSPDIGYPWNDEQRRSNFCGSGNMLAIDYRGNFYPCVRFMDSAVNGKEGRNIGNSHDGICYDKIRAFNALSYDSQSPEKCLTCDIASGCTWCTGLNYDASPNNTIFERQIFNCKMHHANVVANRYFWNLYENKTGDISPLRYNTYTVKSSMNKYLYIYKNNFISTCYAHPQYDDFHELSDEDYIAAIKLCEDKNLIPVHIGFNEKKKFGYYIGYPTANYERDDFTVDILEHSTILNYAVDKLSKNLIYKIDFDKINFIYNDIANIAISKRVSKISVIINDYHKWTKEQLNEYRDILAALSKMLYDYWAQNYFLQIDIITDNLFMRNKQFCSAGINQWTVAPDGNLYACIADYFCGEKSFGGIDVIKEIPIQSNFKKQLIHCEECNVKKCNKCFHLNKKLTCESIVPFEAHCVKSNLELSASVNMLHMIEENNIKIPFDINKKILPPNNMDPLVDLRGKDSFLNQKLYTV